MGADSRGWRWGRIHQARVRHPLGEIDTTWNVPHFPRAGDRATIDVAGYARFDTAAAIPARVTHGPALRWMTSLGPDATTRGVSLPGQSERTDAPHRTDQLEMWRNGRLRTLPRPGERPERPASEVRLPVTPRR
jgi:penicillin amidase